MLDKTVIAIMQLKGISRKTLVNSIPIPMSIPYSLDFITNVLANAKENNKRIKEYSDKEVSIAMDEAEKIEENCRKFNIQTISYFDDKYPMLLKKSGDPPALIYYRGDLSYINTMDAVAIVGTREPSAFGSKIAFKLGERFAEKGFIDVSGLSLGCDTEGHKGCLNAGGKTIAVLAGGLDSVYPGVNKNLAEEIVEKGGALLSEYPPFARVFKGSFVDRDRIQAALCCGVMVVETREKGGTLHAVRYAGDYGRIVGCFKHTEKFKDVEQAAGNRMIVNEGKGIYVGDNDELNDFCDILAKKGKELKEPAMVSSAVESNYEQMSLFDDQTNKRIP